MGVPSRFVTEYPERCLELLEAAEPIARARNLLTSFSLLAAASVLLIPYERLGRHHPNTQERGSSLFSALRGLEKVDWLQAPFWRGRGNGRWHFSRIMGDPNDVAGWSDHKGRRSVAPDSNLIDRKKAGEVLRVLRNALAHGNVVYLNGDFQEIAGTPVQYIAFLSRYEETEEQRNAAQTYRVVAARDEEFLDFLKSWASWISTFPAEQQIEDAA